MLTLVNFVSANYISEINYNPEGPDNNKEYIEIITNLDLSNFTLEDSSSLDTLKKLKTSNNTIALIVEENYNISNLDANIYTTGATIGNGLNNDEDILILKDGSKVIEYIHYYSSWGANGNGKSLCRLNKESQFQECSQSPGFDNSIETGSSNYNIEITELLPNPYGDDDAQMPEGEWIEIFNHESFDINLEKFYFQDNNQGTPLTITNFNTESTTIKANSYLVIYINGKFGFLNNKGFEKITFYDDNNNKIQSFSYSESKEGQSISKLSSGWKHTIPTPNKENNEENIGKDSSIKINKVYLGNDNKAKFGDTIRIKLDIYKGETTKNELKLYLEKNSQRITLLTKFSVFEGFTDTTYTLPILIPPNCDNELEEGNYEIIIEGFNEEDSEKIEISENNEELCKKVTITKEVKTPVEIQDNSENIINDIDLQDITSNSVYESQSAKSKKLAGLFFITSLILVTIGTIIKK